jgi:hypothetical protein
MAHNEYAERRGNRSAPAVTAPEGEEPMTSWPWLSPRHVRIARPTDQLDEVARFYREGLGLPEIGRFAGHAGYRGVLLGLPGTQYHLEFTQHDHGSPGQAPSRDNLLVLYLDGLPQAEQAASRLAALGYPRVDAENPYWTDNGAITVEDPDHWRVVLMPRPFGSEDEPHIIVEWYAGDREALRPLFQLAEDSPAELSSYLHSGRILIARRGARIAGHLQLTGTGRPGQAEVKNMAVSEELQGQGHDAFTEATGYPPGSQADGIPLRDRVWLDIQLGSASPGGSAA